MEKILKITSKEALKLYKESNDKFKILLEESFGKQIFSSKLIDRIKCFDDILEELNCDELDIIPYKTPKNKKQKSQNAFAKIQAISEVLNEEEILDFNNKNNYKYYPYFYKENNGWVLDSGADDGSLGASAGFGCYFKSSELALFAGKVFRDIYLDYISE